MQHGKKNFLIPDFNMRLRLFFLILFFEASALPVSAQDLPVIRMVVADKVSDCSIGISGPYRIQDADTKILLSGDFLSNARLTCPGGTIQMDETELPGRRLTLEAQESDIRVAGMAFAPRMEIISGSGGRFTLVSLLDVEEYTRGVMEKEMEPLWPREALKAQAILARTNAVYAYAKNQGRAFHLTRSSPQVYERIAAAHPNAVGAVDETRGLVLMVGDAIIPAYFHSACGGGTEAAKNVWQQSRIYPPSVPCDFCKDAPKFHWTSRISMAVFESKCAAAGVHVRGTQNIFASKISAVSDRITEIVVEHATGKVLMRTNTLRAILGHDVLRSTNFHVTFKDDALLFTGQGWGHGVGLCQWGARAMANDGKSYEEIIKYYYPGARISEVKQ